MEYYSAIKRNELGSLVVMWMDLESVTQNEVCQKEKNKYQILTHTCGVEKSSTDEHICRTGIEMKMWRKDMWIQREGEGEGYIGRVTLTDTHYHV